MTHSVKIQFFSCCQLHFPLLVHNFVTDLAVQSFFIVIQGHELQHFFLSYHKEKEWL